ncbi:hypothetical protein SAMN03097694_2384 [Janthinobacterium lividum]|uniref:Uncharacterized protein n=1 Tax=Janthinobacterium lividum TaxID=29581 RepID=A0AB38C7G8_9BURK|nr:hypothetical protein SAMN03097694_2384 [Janthinobacterium lividum]
MRTLAVCKQEHITNHMNGCPADEYASNRDQRPGNIAPAFITGLQAAKPHVDLVKIRWRKQLCTTVAAANGPLSTIYPTVACYASCAHGSAAAEAGTTCPAWRPYAWTGRGGDAQTADTATYQAKVDDSRPWFQRREAFSHGRIHAETRRRPSNSCWSAAVVSVGQGDPISWVDQAATRSHSRCLAGHPGPRTRSIGFSPAKNYGSGESKLLVAFQSANFLCPLPQPSSVIGRIRPETGVGEDRQVDFYG